MESGRSRGGPCLNNDNQATLSLPVTWGMLTTHSCIGLPHSAHSALTHPPAAREGAGMLRSQGLSSKTSTVRMHSTT